MLTDALPGDLRDEYGSAPLLHVLYAAEDEVDSQGDLGLTVSFEEVRLLDESEGWFDRREGLAQIGALAAFDPSD